MFLLFHTVGPNGKRGNLSDIEEARRTQREKDRIDQQKKQAEARELRVKELREQLTQRTRGMRNPVGETGQSSKSTESPLEKIKAATALLEKTHEKVLDKQKEVKDEISKIKEEVKKTDPQDKDKLKQLGGKLARLNIFDQRLQVLIDRRERNKTVNEARLKREEESKARIDKMVNERLRKHGIDGLSQKSDAVDDRLAGRKKSLSLEDRISKLDRNNSIYTTYKSGSKTERSNDSRASNKLNPDVSFRYGNKDSKYISYKTKDGSGFNIDKESFRKLKWNAGRKDLFEQIRAGKLTENDLRKYNITYVSI